MNRIQLFILKQIVKKTCKLRTIPRSGPKAKKVNCYGVYFYNDRSEIFCVTDMSSTEFSGTLSMNYKGGIEHKELISKLKYKKVKIRKYCGQEEILFHSIYSLLLYPFYYFKVKLKKYMHLIKRFFYNNKKFNKVDDIEILEAIYSMYNNNAYGQWVKFSEIINFFYGTYHYHMNFSKFKPLKDELEWKIKSFLYEKILLAQNLNNNNITSDTQFKPAANITNIIDDYRAEIENFKYKKTQNKKTNVFQWWIVIAGLITSISAVLSIEIQQDTTVLKKLIDVVQFYIKK